MSNWCLQFQLELSTYKMADICKNKKHKTERSQHNMATLPHNTTPNGCEREREREREKTITLFMNVVVPLAQTKPNQTKNNYI